MNDWFKFFRPYFPSEDDAAAFVEQCESINRDYRAAERREDSTPKVMMHQTVRLVQFADQVAQLRPSYDPLRILFLLVCAECVKKLFERYREDGLSKDCVRRFFADHVSAQDKELLRRGVTVMPPDDLSDQDIVDVLYAIRCDVVHEGRFWGFSFPTDDTPLLNLNPLTDDGRPPVIVGLRFADLRDIIVRGCIEAIRKDFRNRQPGR